MDDHVEGRKGEKRGQGWEGGWGLEKEEGLVQDLQYDGCWQSLNQRRAPQPCPLH